MVCPAVISGDESPKSLRVLQADEQKPVEKTLFKFKDKLCDPGQKLHREKNHRPLSALPGHN